jgi:hypothetical protein
MSLKDLIIADTESLFLNTDDFATSVYVVPASDLESATGTLVLAVFSDMTATDQLIESGAATTDRIVDCYFSTATTSVALGRTMRRGDTIKVPEGAYKGIWKVQHVEPDEGNMIKATLRMETISAYSGKNIREVR